MSTQPRLRIADQVAASIAERARSRELSRWEKARDLLELQNYLKVVREPASTRDLARLTGLGHTQVVEQLVVAAALTEQALGSYGLTPESLRTVPLKTLIRVAKLPPYLRPEPLRAATRISEAEQQSGSLITGRRKGGVKSREARRKAVYTQLCAGSELQIALPRPLPEMTRAEVDDALDAVLPALARLAEAVIPPQRSHYAAVAGNGGIVVYLCPQPGEDGG